jgi:O-succinylbenzoate synthase
MRPEAVDLRIVSLPMATPFTAAHGSISTRTVVIIRVVHSDGEGWGECAALPEPTYTDEYVDDAFLTLRDHLVPALFATTGPVTADGLTDTLGAIQGHPMAKAAHDGSAPILPGRRRTFRPASRSGCTTPPTISPPTSLHASPRDTAASR